MERVKEEGGESEGGGRKGEREEGREGRWTHVMIFSSQLVD